MSNCVLPMCLAGMLRQILANELTARLGVDVNVDEVPDLQLFGHVDDHYATFEWSEGGMIHAHMAFWIVGSPRIDKILVPKEREDGAVELDASLETDVILKHLTKMNSYGLANCLIDWVLDIQFF